MGAAEEGVVAGRVAEAGSGLAEALGAVEALGAGSCLPRSRMLRQLHQIQTPTS